MIINGVEIIVGDARDVLAAMPADSIDCVVTSPPYWGLRDYGVAGQIGLESTLEGYIETMRHVGALIHRVLRPDGTFWLNLGDSYSDGGRSSRDVKSPNRGNMGSRQPNRPKSGLKPKDLCMVPARVAMALQADGWWLRSEIIWAKPSPMPEST